MVIFHSYVSLPEVSIPIRFLYKGGLQRSRSDRWTSEEYQRIGNRTGGLPGRWRQGGGVWADAACVHGMSVMVDNSDGVP